jgi:enhancing lycopene biosynthesis protein 2
MGKKRVAVVLSGCGVYDGAEIHESVLTLLALDRAGVEIVCAAPDVPQHHVIDHGSGSEAGERRSVLAESARIARGKVKSLAQLSADDVDAAIFPGGFGAAKNLCDFAFHGAEMKVEPTTEKFVRSLLDAKKPVGFMCIAPVIAAKLIPGCELTIGTDAETAARCEKMGAKHVARKVEEIHVDTRHRVVTTPAYMLAERVTEAATGIDRLVSAVLELA